MLHPANVSTPDYIFPNLCLLSKLCLQIYRKKQLIYFPNMKLPVRCNRYINILYLINVIYLAWFSHCAREPK